MRDVSTNLGDSLLAAWATSSRTTAFLVERIPAELWKITIPGFRTRSMRSIAAHLHNSRCSWTTRLGSEHGIVAAALVQPRAATRRQLRIALEKSSAGIADLLALGLARGGTLPLSKGYVWRNLPLDVGHVLSYFVAHEGHHRGQLVMAARQLGVPLPAEVIGGLWQWQRRKG